MIFALLLCHFMLYDWHRCKRRKNEKGYRGIYVTKDVLEDEMYMFQLKNSKAIFCNNSSLYLWNLTEKTLCDIINNKDCMDLETRNKSIREIFQRDDFDIDKMYQYAKTMKIYDKVSNYVEVLL